MPENLIIIGRIGRCFGLKGDVFVEPLTYSPARFKKCKKVYIGFDDKKVIEANLRLTRLNERELVVRFDTYETREDVERFKNAFVFIDEKDAIKLPKGKYFIHQLIGLGVEDKNGKSYGTIKDIISMLPNNLYVIDYKGKEFLVPALKQFVKKIEIENKKIIINVIDGLFDV